MPVDPLPVSGDPRRHAAQDMRRQVFDRYPREVHHIMPMFLRQLPSTIAGILSLVSPCASTSAGKNAVVNARYASLPTAPLSAFPPGC